QNCGAYLAHHISGFGNPLTIARPAKTSTPTLSLRTPRYFQVAINRIARLITNAPLNSGPKPPVRTSGAQKTRSSLIDSVNGSLNCENLGGEKNSTSDFENSDVNNFSKRPMPTKL